MTIGIKKLKGEQIPSVQRRFSLFSVLFINNPGQRERSVLFRVIPDCLVDQSLIQVGLCTQASVSSGAAQVGLCSNFK